MQLQNHSCIIINIVTFKCIVHNIKYIMNYEDAITRYCNEQIAITGTTSAARNQHIKTALTFLHNLKPEFYCLLNNLCLYQHQSVFLSNRSLY